MSFISDFINMFRGPTVFVSGSGARSRQRDRRIDTDEMCSAIIDCNATHFAKGQIVHVVQDTDGRTKQIKRNSEYTRLFNKPNPMMTRQDFMYAMAWQLQLTNTAFAWVKWDNAMHPLEVWPLVYLQFEVRKLKDGSGYAVQFNDGDGVNRIVRMEDLIVLRRKYDGSGYAGSDNTQIGSTLDMVTSLDEGLKAAVEISNKIHGIVKQKNSMLAPTSVKDTQKNFVERMKEAAKEGGVVSLDGTEEYTPLNVTAWSANAAQQKQITERVYTFWRTPEEVVKNTASEQVMQNYYDSIIEPMWEEMALACTDAVFTRREQGHGNKMVVYSGAATGASWSTKLNIIANSKETGLLSRNEQRELLGYGPVEDGDEFLVSLNYIKSTDQSLYQTGKDDNKEGPKKDPDDGGGTDA